MPSTMAEFTNVSQADGEVELEWYENPFDYDISRIWINKENGDPVELHPHSSHFKNFRELLMKVRYEHFLDEVAAAEVE